MAWPPTLDDFKADLPGTYADDEDDASLAIVLAAAIAYVQRVRSDLVGVALEAPDPGADFELGVLRLARRWDERRKSPDGIVSLGDLGSGRVPGVDPDIERMLGIGRWGKSVFA